MSTYDEASLDSLSSEASERLHSLHEVGDWSPSMHCKQKKFYVATFNQPKRLALHLDVQWMLTGHPCMWGLLRRGTEPSAG